MGLFSSGRCVVLLVLNTSDVFGKVVREKTHFGEIISVGTFRAGMIQKVPLVQSIMEGRLARDQLFEISNVHNVTSVLSYGQRTTFQFFVRQAATHMGVPAFIDLTEWLPVSFRSFANPNYWDHWFFNIFSVRHFDGAICISDFWRHRLKDDFGMSVLLVPAMSSRAFEEKLEDEFPKCSKR